MKVCFFANAPMDLIRIVGFYQTDIKILKELGFDVKISNSFRNIYLDSDIFYAYWASSGAKAILVSKLVGKPSILTLGGSDVAINDPTSTGYNSRPFLHKLIIKWNLGNADVVLADSKDVLKQAKYLGAKNLKLCYFAIDTKKYYPKNVKKENWLIIVSHLSKQNLERKRLTDIIFAMKYVVSKVPNTKLVFVGKKLDGFQILRNLSKNLGLAKNVIFTGKISEEEKIKYLNKSKAFVQPSLHEGFGLAMVEAMACGLPVIVTRKGATPEVAGNAAIYVPVMRPDILAQAMIKVLKNPRLAESIGKKARERVVKNFTYEKRKAEIKKIIEKLIKQKILTY